MKIRKHRDDLVSCAILTLLWLLTVQIIGLEGEFPLSDDWVYAKTTWDLVETGEFVRSGWTYAPIISNVAIGASFTRLFGSTFEVLRASSVFMGWIGILGAYLLCRQLGSSPRWSVAGAGLYGWNPLHVALSFTFMTDVAFGAFCTWSLVFLVPGLRALDKRWIGAGASAALAAILSRQLGLAIPIAAAIAAVVGYLPRLKTLVLIAVTVAVAAGIFAYIPALFYGSEDSSRMFTLDGYVRKMLFGPNALYFISRNSVVTAIYLGAFLAPLALLGLGNGTRRRQNLVAGSGLCLVLVATVLLTDQTLPPGMDWIYDLGLGPINLIGASARPRLGSGGWLLIIAIASFSTGVTLMALYRSLCHSWNDPRQRAVSILLLVFPLVYLAVLLPRHPWFDRYAFPILPALIALMLPRASKRPRAAIPMMAAAMVATTLLIFGVFGTRDYLEHNRARSELLDDLLAQGISPSAIDGGAEFGIQHSDGRHWGEFIEEAFGERMLDDEYIVGFASELPGYQAIKRASYRRLLPPMIEELTVHHRIGAALGPPGSAAKRDVR